MAQIKIFGHLPFLQSNAPQISRLIHQCSVEHLQLPTDKKFHRFIPIEAGLFFHPDDRSSSYIIIEIHMFSGRTSETKKQYIKALMHTLSTGLPIPINDIEITVVETPKENWGIRGVTGDELKLNYKVSL